MRVLLADDDPVQRQPGKRYKNIVFSRPGPKGITDHVKVADHVLHLDVGKLADEMRAAMAKWFADLAKRSKLSHARNVDRNVGRVARSEAPKGPIPRTLTPGIQQNFTTSSP
jgi:hypothetical protein